MRSGGMMNLGRGASIPLAVILVVCLVVASPEAAPSPATTETADAPDALRQARDRVLKAQYEEAIEVLEGILAGNDDPRILQDTYLLLINAHVLRANDFQSRGDVRTADLWRGKAEELIMKCLGTPGLRSTRPVPESEYPPEMVALFRDVRAAMLGGFRVIQLEPPDAQVILDGDTLAVIEGTGIVGDDDLPVGQHVVEVRAKGYESRSEQITLRGGSTLERTYLLDRGKGFWWWASRSAVLAGGVTAAILIGGSGGDGQPEPLPGPPDPPR